MLNWLLEQHQQRIQKGIERHRLCLEKRSGRHATLNQQNLLNFASNDYLGLSQHPEVQAAVREAMCNYGVSGNASQLVSGYTTLHRTFENRLANFLGCESALLFPSGYMANLAAMTSLAHPGLTLYLDRLSHASLYEGIQQHRFIRWKRFQHGDMKHLETLLAADKHATSKLIVTDGVFSTCGNLANLPMLVKLAQGYNAQLLVDDTHGIGLLGARGRGTIEHYQCNPMHVDLVTGSLAKAFGSGGGFIAGKRVFIEHFIQSARTAIFTASLSPLLASGALASLTLMDTQTQLRAHLQRLIAHFQKGASQRDLHFNKSITPIQSIKIGSNQKAEQIKQSLREKAQILITTLRPPSVPEGEACVRITLNAHHRMEDIDTLLNALHTLGIHHASI